ncbi:hypothetical protein [Parvularcula lutaonensis]|uniref:Uncharacterized protein n=1 Tax=Parvularcula lutaonensis TaxID=491923 RepID=A0ABV7MFE9_9PROT|nr:hypothetical protein [Parvularcula lutaonensis]GGY49797.1 hypothetical protein GCM10007148_18050 [Parvularcula lutaonensis]
MEAIAYLFSLGFSGTDAIRAAGFIVIGSLIVSNRLPPWKVTLAIIFIDFLWPYVAMLRDGGGMKAVEISIRGLFLTFDDTFAGYLVRWSGFYVAIRGIFSLRKKLHDLFPEESEKQKKGAMPF